MVSRTKSTLRRAVKASRLSTPEVNRRLSEQVVWRNIGDLRPYPQNARKHPESQIRMIMKAMKIAFTNPILIDETDTILAGHGRLECARRLEMLTVPTLTLPGLSAAQKRALVISDNRLPEKAVWDYEVLRSNFVELIDADFDVELTGFSTGEVDLIIDESSDVAPESLDELFNVATKAVSRRGDKWLLGRHSLLCGDAQQAQSFRDLIGDDFAQMVVTDPPYNVRISGHAMGRGKIRHREFAMASGEMTDAQYVHFLEPVIRNLIAFSIDGSIHYLFIDWRHHPHLYGVATPLYSEYKNLLVWNKNNAGQGSFYRSKHELIAVYKNGAAPHINNFGLGAEGRHRANVLDHPGVSSFSTNRQKDLALHREDHFFEGRTIPLATSTRPFKAMAAQSMGLRATGSVGDAGAVEKTFVIGTASG